MCNTCNRQEYDDQECCPDAGGPTTASLRPKQGQSLTLTRSNFPVQLLRAGKEQEISDGGARRHMYDRKSACAYRASGPTHPLMQ
jgi:hypothetical protein